MPSPFHDTTLNANLVIKKKNKKNRGAEYYTGTLIGVAFIFSLTRRGVGVFGGECSKTILRYCTLNALYRT